MPFKPHFIIHCLVVVLLLPFLGGCSQSASFEEAATAVEFYVRALVDQDLNQMINNSCSAWESQAKLEYDSFAAVKISLEGLDCQTTQQQADYVLVDCAGVIIANYGAEDLIIELSERRFKALWEGGEWRMCGYQ